MIRFFRLSLLFVTIVSSLIVNGDPVPRLETYITAQQVDSLMATLEGREKALRVFQDIGITKIYLETIRSGYVPSDKTLIDARDFFRENGIEVSCGVTSTAGKEFGTPSNRSNLWLNYQSEKTQNELSDHFRKIATQFDEIMIDDFFATNDRSEESVTAKGDRSWPEYRLDLMSDVAKRCAIQPAREANPDVQLILKYPQWYDRFHCFGYNVSSEPTMFDRIWVGTETRNPDTKRYGFVMPTQGYINYAWLRSIAGKKTGGAWFDFGDCTAQAYLMQAYQSVMAGAEEIVLFEAGSVIKRNPCIEPFMQRRVALYALGRLLHERKALGMAAYKPPHSDGSDLEGGANLYVFDYLATLGLAPLPTVSVPENAPAVFLPRQAVTDPNILKKIRKWLARGTTVVTTPDFLSALGDRQLTEQAGYEYPISLDTSEVSVERFRVDGTEQAASVPVRMRPLALPTHAEILCAGLTADKEIPLLTRRKNGTGGTILVLNINTFAHEEFGPGKEEFLPPRPLSVKNWPVHIVNRIRKAIPSPYGIRLEGDNHVGACYYDGNILVLANFNESPATVSLSWKNAPRKVSLHPDFPHATGTRLVNANERDSISIPPWELAVLNWN